MEVWIQFGITLVTTAGLFLWVRTESRNDFRKSEEENKQIRRDLVDVMRSIEKDMRDFHGRLCAIEERRLNGKLNEK